MSRRRSGEKYAMLSKETRSRHSLYSFSKLLLILCVALTPDAFAQGVGYWHTKGGQILDADNNEVRIAGINWYGFETTDLVAHGLYSQDYHTILNAIHTQGYNTIRLPFSNQMVESPIIPTAIALQGTAGPINTDLAGLNSQQIMDKIITAAGALGLKVILDNHRSEAGNSNEPNGLWYTSTYPESNWIADWKTLVAHYMSYTDFHGNPIVIGVDLRNEPHLLAGSGKTGSCWTGDNWTNGCPLTDTAQNWPAAAGRAADAIQTINPGLLIFVEGTDCYSGDCGWQGANLEGAGKYPVTITHQDKLVYSAHDYGPDLSSQAWLNSSSTQASLNAAWTKFWGYLSVDNIAPIWIGEFGTTNASSDIENNSPGSQGQWFSGLVNFFSNHPSINWTYWALNGEDSFGLLDNTYDPTPANSLKQQLLESIQFPLSGTNKTGADACKLSPASPSSLNGSATSYNAITLSWKAVTPPAHCELTYSVYRSTTKAFTPSAKNMIASSLTTAAYADSNLLAATTYYYAVEAVDLHGTSSASAQASVKTLPPPSSACGITYTISDQWSGGFQASIAINNTGETNLSSWKLQWTFPSNQQISSFWGGNETVNGETVTVTNESYNGSLPAGDSITGLGFTASFSGTNSNPPRFTLNGIVCK
jgi:endoglucanase